jgi:hypothetical protein
MFQDEAFHFKEFLKERDMLEHAKLWADCEEYSRMVLKKPTGKNRLDGMVRVSGRGVRFLAGVYTPGRV